MKVQVSGEMGADGKEVDRDHFCSVASQPLDHKPLVVKLNRPWQFVMNQS
jgi:hypothetical protein